MPPHPENGETTQCTSNATPQICAAPDTGFPPSGDGDPADFCPGNISFTAMPLELFALKHLYAGVILQHEGGSRLERRSIYAAALGFVGSRKGASRSLHPLYISSTNLCLAVFED